VIVTGTGGSERGAPAGYVLDAPDIPIAGHPHAGGLDEPAVGVPTLPPEEEEP